MANHGVAGAPVRHSRSPSPRPVQKTPSWTVSQHDSDADYTNAHHTNLSVVHQQQPSLSPLDAYKDANSPQGSHFDEAISLFGSTSDLTTPIYDDNFLVNSLGPQLSLDDIDVRSPPRTSNAPPPERRGLDPDERLDAVQPSIEELERQRTQDATKAGVQQWLTIIDPAPDQEVAEADKTRFANIQRRARAKSTGDAPRIPILATSPKPTSTFSPEAYLNFDDDDDDEDGDDDHEHEDDEAAREADWSGDLSNGHDANTCPTAAAESYGTPPSGPSRNDSEETVTRGRPWEDSQFPMPQRTPSQPQSSNAAMAIFQQRARDIETASVSATIGSRRRSETDISSIFSAAGISVQVPSPSSRTSDASVPQRQRRPSLLDRVLPKRSNSNLKKRKDGEASPPLPADPSHGRKSSESSFAPPKRIGSWGRAKSPYKIDTTVTSGSVRSPPTTAGISISTPKAWQTAKAAVRRSRSPSGGLADIWRQAGGPPVAHLPQGDDEPPAPQTQPLPPQVTSRQQAPVNDDEDDNTFIPASIAVPTSATHEAFKAHVLQMDTKNCMPHFMIERLAQEQVKRYRRLAEAHQRHTKYSKCSSGAFCATSGTGPKLLPPKSGARAADAAPIVFYIPSQHRPHDMSLPEDGSAIMATFPMGVPLPPVSRLPAEFECPLCFQVKRIQKPSDWTKHVHEDVQPFTCTYPNCAEAKSFKRKADWVRHENERHRHLEKWECHIDGCGHICFRKNNFQEHLVREHKLPEIRDRRPTSSSNTSGAPQSSAMADLIESCRTETPKQPTDEPCRFCGELCNTWKKLHVHLAGHLLSISMPVLAMAGMANITIANHMSDEGGQSQPMSDVENDSQNSMSRNISSSPSMARSPPAAIDTSGTYSGAHATPIGLSTPTRFRPQPGRPNQYSSPNNSQAGSFLSVPGGTQQDMLDEPQDPNYLTTSMHTYPPPAMGHRRSLSATRSPTQSWLNPDFQHVSDHTSGNRNMQGMLEQGGQAEQAAAYPQQSHSYSSTAGTESAFYTTSPTYQSSDPNCMSSDMNFAGFPTPVSHSQSQSQSRIVSPNPQQQGQVGLPHTGQAVAGYQSSHSGGYMPVANGNASGLGLTMQAFTNAATYPGRTSTVDDIATNINIVRRQLALEQQAQQRLMQHQQVQQQQSQQQQTQQQQQQVQQQVQQQQQQQQFQQQQHFFEEPQQFHQTSLWAEGLYQAPNQTEEPQYMAQLHLQPGAQVPYTSAPQG